MSIPEDTEEFNQENNEDMAPINEPSFDVDDGDVVAPINDADDVEDIKPADSPLNTDDNSVVEKSEDNSTVDSKDPAIDQTSELNKSIPIESKEAEIKDSQSNTAPSLNVDILPVISPLNDIIKNNTEITENVSNTSEINNSESTNIEGDTITNTDNVITESSGLEINEQSSITNISDSSNTSNNIETESTDVNINSNDESQVNNETAENTSISNGGSFINVLNDLAMNVPVGTTVDLFEENTNEPSINDSENIDVESKQNDVQTSNLNAESESIVESTKSDLSIDSELSDIKSLTKSGETTVAKSKISLDDTVAPIHTPANSNTTQSNVVTELSTPSIDVKEIKPDPITEKVSDSSSKSKEESTPSVISESPPIIVDFSSLENRLRNIENILTGPLDVKIVD